MFRSRAQERRISALVSAVEAQGKDPRLRSAVPPRQHATGENQTANGRERKSTHESSRPSFREAKPSPARGAGGGCWASASDGDDNVRDYWPPRKSVAHSYDEAACVASDSRITRTVLHVHHRTVRCKGPHRFLFGLADTILDRHPVQQPPMTEQRHVVPELPVLVNEMDGIHIQ